MSYIIEQLINSSSSSNNSLKSCVASSTVISTLKSTSTTVEESSTYLGCWTVSGFEGTVRISATIKHARASAGGLFLYINNTDKLTHHFYSSSTSSTTVTADIFVKNGDKLYFTLSPGAVATSMGTAYYNMTCSSIKVCGTLSDSILTPGVY